MKILLPSHFAHEAMSRMHLWDAADKAERKADRAQTPVKKFVRVLWSDVTSGALQTREFVKPATKTCDFILGTWKDLDVGIEASFDQDTPFGVVGALPYMLDFCSTFMTGSFVINGIMGDGMGYDPAARTFALVMGGIFIPMVVPMALAGTVAAQAAAVAGAAPKAFFTVVGGVGKGVFVGIPHAIGESRALRRRLKAQAQALPAAPAAPTDFDSAIFF